MKNKIIALSDPKLLSANELIQIIYPLYVDYIDELAKIIDQYEKKSLSLDQIKTQYQLLQESSQKIVPLIKLWNEKAFEDFRRTYNFRHETPLNELVKLNLKPSFLFRNSALFDELLKVLPKFMAWKYERVFHEPGIDRLWMDLTPHRGFLGSSNENDPLLVYKRNFKKNPIYLGHWHYTISLRMILALTNHIGEVFLTPRRNSKGKDDPNYAFDLFKYALKDKGAFFMPTYFLSKDGILKHPELERL